MSVGEDLFSIATLWGFLPAAMTSRTDGTVPVHRGVPGSRVPVDLEAVDLLDDSVRASKLHEMWPSPENFDLTIIGAGRALSLWLTWCLDQCQVPQWPTTLTDADLEAPTPPQAAQIMLTNLTMIEASPDTENLDWWRLDMKQVASRIRRILGETQRSAHCPVCGSQVEANNDETLLLCPTCGVKRKPNRMIASQIADRLHVPQATVKSWTRRHKLVPYGSDEKGRPQYNLADAKRLLGGRPGRKTKP